MRLVGVSKKDKVDLKFLKISHLHLEEIPHIECERYYISNDINNKF